MKKNFRTPIGKTVLFITVILAALLTVINITAAVGMVSENFYTRDEKTICGDIIDRSYDYNYIGRAVNAGDDPSLTYDLRDENIVVEVTDPKGNVILSTYGVQSIHTYEGRSSVIERTYYVNKEGTIRDEKKDGYQPYTFRAVVKKDLVKMDRIYWFCMFTQFFYPLRHLVYPLIIITTLLAIAAFVQLMTVSGRRDDSEELHPGPLNFIPFDVLVAGFIVLIVLAYMLADTIDTDLMQFIFVLCSIAVLSVPLLGLCMSAAVRLKQGTLFSGLLITWIIKTAIKLIMIPVRFVIMIWENMSVLWKGLLVIGAVTFVEMIALIEDEAVFPWIIEKIIFIPLVVLVLIWMNRLAKGGEALASGNLSYKTDDKMMYGSFKKHARNLNSIAEGMNIAVAEKTKSERMKTELITNVSHDIKTPLTSVINYASLISEEKTSSKKIKEYSEVLLRQSERLKRLIDDLVEASKASTGNLEVCLQECDASVFITQADGEYEQKLKDAELELVTKLPDREARIMADPRRMWRIFDNLMNNICKYSQSGTRVYLSLEVVGHDAVITFKNTSRESLDISAEELMERFVRGDSSRNTEGSGLGLSIARSLAELQGGSLDLSIDGDLFKAILKFPLI